MHHVFVWILTPLWTVSTVAALVSAEKLADSPAQPTARQSTTTDLERCFVDPPPESRPWVYWFIMDGNLSREGITADLEAMQTAGIGGVIIMEVNVGIPRGPVEFMSEQWQDLFRHAVREAERLGLVITTNAGPGWTGSGGPWVKPAQSMQHIVASCLKVEGPQRFDQVLPLPETKAGFFRDEAVLAFPTPEGAHRIEDIREKALYDRLPYSSRPHVKPFLPAPADFPDLPFGAAIDPDRLIDLSDRLDDGGRLTWDVPVGNWTILRFGRTSTGQNTRPAPEPGLGLECDKLDKTALDAHFEAFVGALLRKVEPRNRGPGKGWTMLHIDSWEMGAQNWTAEFRDEFRRRRGYDPLRYLPTVTGLVVGNIEQSERFLWDLRQTVQELIIENHAQHLKELGRRHGFGLSIEPYDMNPASDMTLGGVADVPMCEFWSHGYGFDTTYSCIEATSIAHTLGRPIVAAEAFTASSREAWKLFPATMKDQGDWAFCMGINRFVFHRFAHQPWLDRRPGMTMGPYGVHWDRTQTWWPMVSAYHRYIARCQFLLRQGMPVADICYLVPEGAPHVFRPPSSALEGTLRERRGYDFDGCAPETLIAKTTVKDSQVVFAGGAAYRLLVLPSFDTMTPTLLRKIKELVESGATVVGSPPRKSPSLSDYPRCDQQVQSLAADVWDGTERPRHVAERKSGRGRVLWGGELDPALPNRQSPPLIEQARWIWYPEGNPTRAVDPATRYFRRVFTLDPNKRVRSARIEITADNEFRLQVNGQMVANGDNFHVTYAVDAGALLKQGENVLAVAVTNAGDAPNPAGLIAALNVTYQDGTSIGLVTDRKWQAAKEVEEGWHSSKTSTKGWTDATDLGPAGMGPWRLNTSPVDFPELYPNYEATAGLLAEIGLPPDFESDGPIRYTHRRTEKMDIYFVANRTPELAETTCTFRVVGRRPELWDPLTGEIRKLPDFRQRNGRMAVPLRFEPHQSFFVVFRDERGAESGGSGARENFPELDAAGTIDGLWNVSFDPKLGGPERVLFQQLQDWSQRSDPGIKNYSGIAVYENTFDLPQPLRGGGKRILIDLGIVHNLARVRLNGRDLGVVWCAPWRVDVTNTVQARANRLEIQVANLWPNRLIGDKALPPEQQVTWTTWNPYTADSPLLPSGLMGPVTLKVINARTASR
jgi:hypothetical protein